MLTIHILASEADGILGSHSTSLYIWLFSSNKIMENKRDMEVHLKILIIMGNSYLFVEIHKKKNINWLFYIYIYGIRNSMGR